jgi:hypothetical protein
VQNNVPITKKLFLELKVFRRGFKNFALSINKEEWAQVKCTCPTFFKMYMCKHVIGLSIRLKYTVPPVEAKNIPLGQKRKRGRPSKAKPALIIQ